ncbi:FKBP-type peptidyl-prolyl cis-trans isomerase [Aidingimonas halophila]|uniref:Peptidyl-prolyl cis-trans isomerase n=1 Tax=Aidingimonas halophila TaxID=574349 RepID=A0A1H2Y3A0_9GAMM|nr:FKBP-type peptidyl-prolyl cis-trans isomerase [Aidingimonas halophila]GHC34393.1 outer membrane protein MIP [Aidingimonas halophila]SDW99606.1 FKBP-type peptidyl-prolyl cis-trans isomerase FklB [Aidingimonas halophila]
MKTPTFTVCLVTSLGMMPLANADALQSDEEKLSYSLGVTLGQSLLQDIDELDIDAFTQAIEDVYAENALAMSEEEMATTLSRFQEEAMAERQSEANQAAQANQEEGQRFLADNAEKEGVEVTESGLQYRVMESGDGASPTADDTVEVHYEGKLLDGTVFDSSYERDEPVSFRVDQVIEGWQEALQMMSVGDTWMVYIPAELGYGAQGQGPIGPNETLTFKIELLDIEE